MAMSANKKDLILEDCDSQQQKQQWTVDTYNASMMANNPEDLHGNEWEALDVSSVIYDSPSYSSLGTQQIRCDEMKPKGEWLTLYLSIFRTKLDGSSYLSNLINII